MRLELKTPKAGTALTILCFFAPILFGLLALGLCKLKRYRETQNRKAIYERLMKDHEYKEYDD